MQLDELKMLIGSTLSLQIKDSQELQRLKLISNGGKPLLDNESVQALKTGDKIIAIVAPKDPSQKIREAVLSSGTNSAADDVDDDVDDIFKISPNAPRWKRRLAHALIHKLFIPEPIVALVFLSSFRFWSLLLVWSVGSHLAARYDIGPIYIIITVFSLMIWNLGTRNEGSLSAYSIFNANLQRLPGQLDAADLDGQLRRGQM